MIWDFIESNHFLTPAGILQDKLYLSKVVFSSPSYASVATASQKDAATQSTSADKVISSDPPYYDNIAYADLSDFFYVWLRRAVRSIYPDLFATLAVPKAEELIATPYRHGNKEKAETFFIAGMTDAMRRLAKQSHPAYPVTIYYAFKQSETKGDTGMASTGWETFLAAVIESDFSITGTWPMRTEYTGNLKKGFNALASSIVLVCRQRPADAPMATRREFVAALRAELPTALAHLQSGNIAPVDLAQAAIGPGMAVFTRYAKVLDAEGNPVSVREALALINQLLDEVLAEQEGDLRRRQPLGLGVVRAARLRRGRIRRRRNPVQSQKHQHRWHRRRRHPRLQRGQGAPAAPGRVSRRLGPNHRRPAHRVGSSPPPHPRPGDRRRARKQRGSRPNSAQKPTSPVNWPTVSTPSANASAAPPKPSPTTA